MQFPYIAERTVEHYLTGTRIDTFLAKHLRNYTAWRLHRMVRAGLATVNGAVVSPDQRIFTGQQVAIRLVEPPDDPLPASNIPLEIVAEDPWLIVVNKPAGLIVHPCGETPTGTLANAVQHFLNQQTEVKGLLRPGIIHRLDRDTSGVVAVAKEHLSHRLLSIEFQKERIRKAYLAILDGVLHDDTGLIDLPIGRAAGGVSALMSCRADAVDAKPSRTAYEVVERFPRHTLVKVKPRTGRMHQIRIHFATLGHPIVGDEWYGPFGELKPPRTLPRDQTPPVSLLIPRMALHAVELEFAHPITQDWSRYTAPLPADFQQALQLIRSLPPE
ncbi:RluA family pseudouridine synthase [Planctellipticum variicoloris]|uniref:RluA family pseudouridine synthase n=1 Tax=Planctellipticum variicoloris TaxID=3064265 RepID=UPI003013C20A|nr:RluA family pseudouridine synthase [Planctomycetaceae bacterium SH412]